MSICVYPEITQGLPTNYVNSTSRPNSRFNNNWLDYGGGVSVVRGTASVELLVAGSMMSFTLKQLHRCSNNIRKTAILIQPRLFQQHSLYRSFTATLNPMSTDKAKVYVTRRIPESALRLLTSRYDVRQWDSDEPVPAAELMKNVPGIDALFCLLTDNITHELLKAAGQFMYTTVYR